MSATGVATLVARAEQLPIPDESFDLVVCVHALHHIDRPVRAIDEMARVLAPGGRLVLEDFIADDDRGSALRWEEAERLRDPDHVRLLTSGEARGAALAAGLTVEAEESWFETFNVDRWLALAETGGDAAARVRALLGVPEVQDPRWSHPFSPAGGQAAELTRSWSARRRSCASLHSSSLGERAGVPCCHWPLVSASRTQYIRVWMSRLSSMSSSVLGGSSTGGHPLVGVSADTRLSVAVSRYSAPRL